MANYVTSVSDFSKSKVLKAWLFGLFGTIGIQQFAVRKIKVGIGRLAFGVFVWIIAFMLAFDEDIAATDGGAVGVVLAFVILFIPAIFDLIRILLGTFRDNVGNAVRSK